MSKISKSVSSFTMPEETCLIVISEATLCGATERFTYLLQSNQLLSLRSKRVASQQRNTSFALAKQESNLTLFFQSN
jgi:hypothetical protein